MSAYAALSRLLDYPTELPSERADGHRAVRAFIESIAGLSLGELQREYVVTFDFDRRAALHLTFHVHGDRRQRGIELVRLKRRIAAAGLELDEHELPDYLPALLELAALEPATGEAILLELRESIELVRLRLLERGSRYALLLEAVGAALPSLTARQLDHVRRLAEAEPPGELVGLEPFAPPPVLGGAA